MRGKKLKQERAFTVECIEEVCGVSGMMDIIDMNEFGWPPIVKKKKEIKKERSQTGIQILT